MAGISLILEYEYDLLKIKLIFVCTVQADVMRLSAVAFSFYDPHRVLKAVAGACTQNVYKFLKKKVIYFIKLIGFFWEFFYRLSHLPLLRESIYTAKWPSIGRDPDQPIVTVSIYRSRRLENWFVLRSSNTQPRTVAVGGRWKGVDGRR